MDFLVRLELSRGMGMRVVVPMPMVVSAVWVWMRVVVAVAMVVGAVGVRMVMAVAMSRMMPLLLLGAVLGPVPMPVPMIVPMAAEQTTQKAHQPVALSVSVAMIVVMAVIVVGVAVRICHGGLLGLIEPVLIDIDDERVVDRTVVVRPYLGLLKADLVQLFLGQSVEA